MVSQAIEHERSHSRPDMIEPIEVRRVELGPRTRHGLLIIPEAAGHVGERDCCHELPGRAVRHFLAGAVRECRVEDARIGAQRRSLGPSDVQRLEGVADTKASGLGGDEGG